MTVTVGQAFDALGYALKTNETVCIVTNVDGRFIEQSLHDVANEPIGTNRYLSSGTFPKSTRWGTGMRTIERCQRVLFLPFDFDLKDFLNISKDDVLDLSSEEIEGYIPHLQDAVESIFDQIGLPISRLDYTGNGLAAHIALPAHAQNQVPVLKEIHAGIVRRINTVYGAVLADAQVSDAGSRIMRLIPCDNVGRYSTKRGEEPGPRRKSRNLYHQDAYVTEGMLRVASDMISFTPRPTPVPEVGDVLSTDDVLDIIELYKPYNEHGHKHYLSVGIAGQLANLRIPESQALKIINGVHEGDRKPWDRRKSVADTYRKVREGKKISGFYILKQYVPEHVINDVDRICQEAVRATGPTIKNLARPVDNGQDRDDKSRPVRFEEYPEPPMHAFYGWFGKYVELMHPSTEASRGFHLAAILNVAGAVVGRRVAVLNASDKLYPGQFTIIVGPTGSSRKGTTMKRAHRMPSYRGPRSTSLHVPPYHVVRDIGSGPALVKTLKEHKNVLAVFEEATTLFAKIQRKGGEELLDRLIEAWDTPDFIQDNVKREPARADDFFLSILAGTQPGRLEDAITANEIDSGLANRTCIFFGVRRDKKAIAPKLDEAAAEMLYADLLDSIKHYTEGTILELDDDAAELWTIWYAEYSEYQGTEDEMAMRIRHPEMVLKWALLFAVTDKANAVQGPHLEAAFAVLDWMWEGIRRRLPSWGVSIDKKIEELVFATLRRDGAMKRRELQIKCSRRKWSGREFANVFRAMIENGHITVGQEGYVMLSVDFERDQAKRKAAAAKAEAA